MLTCGNLIDHVQLDSLPNDGKLIYQPQESEARGEAEMGSCQVNRVREGGQNTHDKEYDAVINAKVTTWCSNIAQKSFLRSSHSSSMNTDAV